MTSYTLLNPRQFAILRHVWTLTTEERSWLDRFSLYKSTASGLLSLATRDHEWKDLLTTGNHTYEVEYLDCSYRFLLGAGNSLVLISLRHTRADRFSVALVKIPHRKLWQQIKDDTNIPELVP